MDKKAVVLCGGGAKGAYQIGALQALKKIGYNYEIVTGTSVGALNGCFAVMDDLKLGYKIWSNINMDSIFNFNKNQKDISKSKSMIELTKELIKSGTNASYEPLKKLIDDNVDEDKIRTSNIEFGFITTQFMPLKKVEIYKEQIPEGQIKDYVMASAACYPYMKSFSVNNKMYIDGGFFDNMPVDMAIKKGATDIVVIDLKGIGKLNKQENIPAKITYVDSMHNLGGIMLFDSTNSKKNIKLGYYDTMKAFNKLEGDFYTFKIGENVKASKYDNKMLDNYKKIFSMLPTATTFESVAQKSILNHLNEYNRELFSINSNVLTVSEMAANIFGIDFLYKYTFKKFSKSIINVYKKYKLVSNYSEILDLKTILSKVFKIEKIKDIVKIYDKKNIVCYIEQLLTKKILSQSEKKDIWILSVVAPDAVLSAIYIRSMMEKNNIFIKK